MTTTRPIYLVSLTPSNDPGIIHLPLLAVSWLHPDVDLSSVDGIIFTSKHGVDAMEHIDPSWKRLPLLCVGKATQRHAETLGGHVVETGEGYGEELFQIVRARYADMRWLYVRPKVVASDFAARLRGAGVAVEERIVYETVCRADACSAQIRDDGILIFTSPSAVACFRARFELRPGHEVVVIGRTTQKSLFPRPVHLAPEPTVAACVALAKRLAKEPT